MERFFQISAVILGGIAAYFLWTKNNDGAFLAAALGAVSFFLSMRVQIKGRLNESERERLALEEEELRRLEEAEENADFEIEREKLFTRERR
jgi:hypothetical protein